MKLDAITSVSALDIWSCMRSLDLELYIVSAPLITWTFPLTPHLELPQPIHGIKYQSFLHNYSSTDTSWVRHPIQVSPSSFPQPNTFKVPCWHCKYQFDIHSIFPRTTGNPVVDTIHDSKMNITDKHFLKWIRTNFRSSSQPIRTSLKNDAIKLLQNYWATLTLPSVMTVLVSCGTLHHDSIAHLHRQCRPDVT